MSETDFIPRWASPPGDTIKDALEEQFLTQDLLLTALGLPAERVQALLAGATPLTIDLAHRLTGLIGGSVEFWMTRDSQYHVDLARLEADKWAQHFPVRDMSALGWIPGDLDDWITRIDLCLGFFDVTDVRAWEANQNALLDKTRFRSSQVVHTDSYAVAAWLRRCEVELSQVDCESWDREGFRDLLPELRLLTKMPDPRKFLPLLAHRCAEVGVAVGIIRAPRGCPISGAARRLPNGQPGIALTGRHRADDHLWFTFFHEAAHLILHDSDVLYLDEIEFGSDAAPSRDEAEADQFAGAILVPPEYEPAVVAARQAPYELRRLAREMGVSMGILVGHLQHRRAVGYATKLNRLKNRYKWDGPTLERA